MDILQPIKAAFDQTLFAGQCFGKIQDSGPENFTLLQIDSLSRDYSTVKS